VSATWCEAGVAVDVDDDCVRGLVVMRLVRATRSEAELSNEQGLFLSTHSMTRSSVFFGESVASIHRR
jgi:hypothetical protein